MTSKNERIAQKSVSFENMIRRKRNLERRRWGGRREKNNTGYISERGTEKGLNFFVLST